MCVRSRYYCIQATRVELSMQVGSTRGHASDTRIQRQSSLSLGIRRQISPTPIPTDAAPLELKFVASPCAAVFVPLPADAPEVPVREDAAGQETVMPNTDVEGAEGIVPLPEAVIDNTRDLLVLRFINVLEEYEECQKDPVWCRLTG